MISLINRWLVYLREVREGLNLFGLSNLLNDNNDLLKTLFVIGRLIDHLRYLFF